ncbi:kinase-like domain-containing protein [Globomyces pollinis-pini]|nr:kinase-like domain-containing protein [Globomyces pollinis-pini]
MLSSIPPAEIQAKKEQSGSLFEVPKLDIIVDAENLLEGSQKVLLDVFPNWRLEDVKLTQQTDGITNKLVRATHLVTKHSVLIRTYGKGSHILIDRHQELMNMLLLSEAGLCPSLYGRFKNGIVYGFVEGDVFTVPDMSDSHKSGLVAKQLATWHNLSLPPNSSPQLFPTLWKWIDVVPESYSDSLKQDKFLNCGFTIAGLKEELVHLQKQLEKLNSPIVFCHNDLLSGNIIYNPKQDSCSFIDYEYGGPSYRGFDIGNHFCEFAGFDCDWDKYPDETFQKNWLKIYLKKLDIPFTEESLHSLYEEVLAFSLAAHFFWSLWALVQAEISDLDFDYLDYAVMRLNEYYKRRGEWLN